MGKRDFKICYHSYTGFEKKAIELIYKEMSTYLLRDSGIYRIHVLACEKAPHNTKGTNAVVVGLYNENEIARKYIREDEIKDGGYVVKVLDNPDDTDFKIAIITATAPIALFYGAVDFVDDYFASAYPVHGQIRLVHELFAEKLPDYYNSSAPAVKHRSVFTWAHPINNYREYIENLARLRFNELILWNDFVPLNARDVVDYAHEFGIKLYFGYAWGWSRNCSEIDLEMLDKLSDNVVNIYEEQYRNTGADGIYFQSFTELREANIGDKVIAEAVTDFVNATADKLLTNYPKLEIKFGLHASSVKDHLDFIAKTDSRIEIMWEDCGAFPYSYDSFGANEDGYAAAEDFTDKILSLREKGSTSMLFKGALTLDWEGDRFVHQAGPYVMGMNSKEVAKNDLDILKPIWRHYESAWIKNGEYANRSARRICKYTDDARIGTAGQYAGGIWLPMALVAQILWECDKPYTEIFDKVTKRRSVYIV